MNAPQRPRYGLDPPHGWSTARETKPCVHCGQPACVVDPDGQPSHPFCAGRRDYMESAEWQLARAPVLKRAGGRCERCGRRARLDVHHKTYVRRGHELPTDLVALCRRCHERADAQREYVNGLATFTEKVYGEYAVVDDEAVAAHFDRWLEDHDERTGL